MADPKINEADGREWGRGGEEGGRVVTPDLPDIRVFIRALRIHSTRCPTTPFVRERLPQERANNISSGFVFGAGYTGGNGGAERYILLILRLYHSFTRLGVVKGDVQRR